MKKKPTWPQPPTAADTNFLSNLLRAVQDKRREATTKPPTSAKESRK